VRFDGLGCSAAGFSGLRLNSEPKLLVSNSRAGFLMGSFLSLSSSVERGGGVVVTHNI